MGTETRLARGPRRTIAVAAGALALAVALPPTAAADPIGRTTFEETIRMGTGAFRSLLAGPGERHVHRPGPLGPALPGRQLRRRSALFFSQLTDPQIADEMSPARVEWIDPAGGAVSASWRPQEAFGTYVFNDIVRNVNRTRTSRMRQGNGARARTGFALLTGDVADNQQYNETFWFLRVLYGGRLDPFSGRRIGPDNPCPGVDQNTVDFLNTLVDTRSYTGVQDYDEYPNAPADRYDGYWDPDAPPPGGQNSPYGSFPRYPGVLPRAQTPFGAEGLRMPVITARGNHDGLVQGNAPASNPLFRAIAVGCMKVFPGTAFDPAEARGASESQIFAAFQNPQFLARILQDQLPVPPDPNRRFLSELEYKRLFPGRLAGGFGLTDRRELIASRGTANYYGVNLPNRIRMISLDTVAEGGGANGNLDDPQFRWLYRELDANSSAQVLSNGRVVRDRDPDRLIVLFSHHTLGTMDNPTPDEEAGCTDPDEPGCDGDPRNSRPIHLGAAGPQSVGRLLLRFPNVVLFVNGHTHNNRITPFRGPLGRSGFWQVNTASHVDWPQQSRDIELMTNRDGTLSIFTTLVNSAAPIATPSAGTTGLSASDLTSLSRRLAANDPQRFPDTSDLGGSGRRIDRNVELIVRNPIGRFGP